MRVGTCYGRICKSTLYIPVLGMCECCMLSGLLAGGSTREETDWLGPRALQAQTTKRALSCARAVDAPR